MLLGRLQAPPARLSPRAYQPRTMVAALTSQAEVQAEPALKSAPASTSGRTGGLHDDVERVLFSEADIARRTSELGRCAGLKWQLQMRRCWSPSLHARVLHPHP